MCYIGIALYDYMIYDILNNDQIISSIQYFQLPITYFCIMMSEPQNLTDCKTQTFNHAEYNFDIWLENVTTVLLDNCL